MKPILFFLLSCFAISLIGCGSLVQEVNPDNIPSGTIKLIVHSYISPLDTVLAVVVEAPKAVIGQRQFTNEYRLPVNNATVDLSDGTKTVRLPFSAKDGLYRAAISAMPIVTGRTYTLTVSAPNYPTTKAQCTVPAAVVPEEIRLDSTTQNNFGQNGVVYVSRLLWRDPFGTVNYYRVQGQTVRSQRVPLNTKPPRDTVFTDVGTIYFTGSGLFSDKDIDGQPFISPKGQYTDYDYRPNSRLVQLRIVLQLNSVDENYYRYHDALDRQSAANDNPFAEPVLIPSNIVGGLGCFGAFNQASLSVRVR